MTYRFQSLALLLAPLVACGGQALDVGSNSGGSSGSSGSGGSGGSGAANGAGNMSTGATAGQEQQPSDPGVGSNGNVTVNEGPECVENPPPGEPLPVWPDREDCQDGTSPLQGTWTGYVQGQAAGGYPDEGNFTVTLKGDDDALCGTITFGAATELEPATDPEVSYPPGYDLSKWIPLVDGYTYQLAEPSLNGKRLQFDILLAEPMRSWCQLQTPYFDSSNGFGWNCQRNVGTQYTYDPEQHCQQVDPCTQEEIQVSCSQVDICTNLSRPCVCNETGCDGNTETITSSYAFDLRFEGDEATGQVNDGVVYLTRD